MLARRASYSCSPPASLELEPRLLLPRHARYSSSPSASLEPRFLLPRRHARTPSPIQSPAAALEPRLLIPRHARHFRILAAVDLRERAAAHVFEAVLLRELQKKRGLPKAAVVHVQLVAGGDVAESDRRVRPRGVRPGTRTGFCHKNVEIVRMLRTLIRVIDSPGRLVQATHNAIESENEVLENVEDLAARIARLGMGQGDVSG